MKGGHGLGYCFLLSSTSSCNLLFRDQVLNSSHSEVRSFFDLVLLFSSFCIRVFHGQR